MLWLAKYARRKIQGRTMFKKIIILISFACILTIASAETVMEVIALEHRPAAEIQPLIAPLLDPSDRVIANGLSLIVKTSPERLLDIQDLISKLDISSSNLLITVVQGRNISADEFNAALNIQANLSLDNPDQSKIRLQGRYYQTNNINTVENTQTLRTVEGRQAYIKVGKAIPVENIQVHSQGFGYPLATSYGEYVEATTGFAVTPRLTANDVILEISPWSDRLRNNRQIETQGASTTLRTKLGMWVEIGGNTESSQQENKGLTAKIKRTQTDAMHILIKVEKTD